MTIMANLTSFGCNDKDLVQGHVLPTHRGLMGVLIAIVLVGMCLSLYYHYLEGGLVKKEHKPAEAKSALCCLRSNLP